MIAYDPATHAFPSNILTNCTDGPIYTMGFDGRYIHALTYLGNRHYIFQTGFVLARTRTRQRAVPVHTSGMRMVRVLLFVGFAAILAFTMYLLFSGGSLENRLDCDRGTGVCTFHERLLTRVSSSWEHLASMGPAEVRTSPAGRRAPVIAVWVKSGEGDSYFDAYATRSAAQKDVDEINRFLGSPSTPHFSLVREHKVLYWTAWSLSLVSVASLGALACVLFFRRAKAAPESGESQVER